MVLDLALGRVVARVGDGARVHAVVVDARLLRRAVRVVRAVLGGAGDVGVAGQAGRAGAHRLVLHPAAHRVPAAGQVVGTADGRALLQAAGVRVCAVGVGETLHRDALNLLN